MVFFSSDNGRKVQDPELLEAIRLTIINNLLEYHPVISSCLTQLSSSICFFSVLEIQFSIFMADFERRKCCYIQESSTQLAMGAAFGISPPKQLVCSFSRAGDELLYVSSYSCLIVLLFHIRSMLIYQRMSA